MLEKNDIFSDRGRKGHLKMSSDAIVTLMSPLGINKESELLGRGGFGTVYRVHNRLDGQYYAVKKVLITEDSIKSALHEVRVLASLTHPHIIRYFHSWVETHNKDRPITDETDQERLQDETLLLYQDCYFFFLLQMECCEMSLRDFMRRLPVRIQDVDTVLMQVLEALDYLHKNGIVHRDMKPDNILLQSLHPLRVVISDFGLAKVFRPDMMLTEQSLYAGTYLYASPEQYKGESCCSASDIYSLGIVLFELQMRFSTDMERIQKIRRLKDRHETEEAIPYQHLVLWMTQGDRRLRPTLQNLRFLTDGNFQTAALWCRDIVWDIVWKLP